jgi:hypothetical protein
LWAEVHRAEAERGNFEAGAAEGSMFHKKGRIGFWALTPNVGKGCAAS